MTTTLSQRAMLTSLLIYRYRAKGHSKEIDSRVTKALNTRRKAGSTQIDLLAPKSLKPTQNAAYHMSKNYLHYTLPWDENHRILPSALYPAFMERHNDLTRIFDMASDDFVLLYPELLQQAKDDLGNEIYQLMKFPSVSDIRSRFDIKLSFAPIPDAGDFRIQLSNDELDMIRQEMREREKAQLARSMHFAWKKLHDAIVDMVERLAKPKFHNTVVENIKAITDVLPELNLANDPQLNEMRDQVIEKLCHYTPQQLRENVNIREDIARQAACIAGSIRLLRLDLNDDEGNMPEENPSENENENDLNHELKGRTNNVVAIGISDVPESRLRVSMGANA
jgi:hypothetical protein